MWYQPVIEHKWKPSLPDKCKSSVLRAGYGEYWNNWFNATNVSLHFLCWMTPVWPPDRCVVTDCYWPAQGMPTHSNQAS